MGELPQALPLLPLAFVQSVHCIPFCCIFRMLMDQAQHVLKSAVGEIYKITGLILNYISGGLRAITISQRKAFDYL